MRREGNIGMEHLQEDLMLDTKIPVGLGMDGLHRSSSPPAQTECNLKSRLLRHSSMKKMLVDSELVLILQ